MKVRVEREEEDSLSDFLRVPKRFIGMDSVICAMRWAATSLSGIDLPTIGVSVGPGDTALTRIPREEARRQTSERRFLSAALASSVCGEHGHTL
jgi:hypothetical protein